MDVNKIKQFIPTENAEQRAFVKWLKLHPKLKELIIKLNNEGKRTEAQAWNLKLMGLCKGASDLFIPYPVKRANDQWYHGLFIEMKRNQNYTPSQRSTDTWIAQESFIKLMKSMGYYAVMCYGWSDAVRVVELYLNRPDILSSASP
jgi:hypothetical protein